MEMYGKDYISVLLWRKVISPCIKRENPHFYRFFMDSDTEKYMDDSHNQSQVHFR